MNNIKEGFTLKEYFTNCEGYEIVIIAEAVVLLVAFASLLWIVFNHPWITLGFGLLLLGLEHRLAKVANKLIK